MPPTAMPQATNISIRDLAIRMSWLLRPGHAISRAWADSVHLEARSEAARVPHRALIYLNVCGRPVLALYLMSEVADIPDGNVLDPMERISETLFGLIMALTFICSLGVATGASINIQTMLIGALGCNLAW